jgi:hypothetical protein
MVPPISAVSSVDGTLPLVDGWAAAPMLAVALDLAQDRARGREMLESRNAAVPRGDDLVVLYGPAMGSLVQAVAALAEAGLRRYAVVGGVAVTARLACELRA